MKRAKTLFTAFAAVIGIGSSIAASKVTSYTYTQTTGGAAYQYNESYSSVLCVAGSEFCMMTCPIKYGSPQSGSTLIASGGHSYGADEAYAY